MASLQDHMLILEEASIHYREAGRPDAWPVILLHGLGEDARGWDEISLALAQDYHIFALDQRGHGESSRTSAYSFEAMRDDLKAFTDKLGLRRFSLIGHSMGGSVAFLFVEMYPERVERLIVEDTIPPYRGMRDPSAAPPAQAPEPVPFDWPVVPAIVAQLIDPDPIWWDSLPTITVPTLLIGGGPTSHISQEKLAEAADLLPNGELVTIDGGEHYVHTNKPAEFIEAVQEFLAR